MASRLDRPQFFQLFFENAASVVRDKGAFYLIPWWIIGLCVPAYLVSEHLSPKFLADASISVAAYAGLLTFNGLLLALAWGAFAKIYEVVCSPSFVKYLRDNDHFAVYLFHVTYIHIVQVSACVVTGLGLLVSISDFASEQWLRGLLAAAFVSTGYAVKEASGAVTIMNDLILIWYRSIFQADAEEKSNVRPFPKSG